MNIQISENPSLDEGIRWAEDEARESQSEMRAAIYKQMADWLMELKRHRMASNAIPSLHKRTIDVISSKKAMAEIGVSKSTMSVIKKEMSNAGYHVVREGGLVWMKPSEIEQYLLRDRTVE